MRRWTGFGLLWAMACGGSVTGETASVQSGVEVRGKEGLPTNEEAVITAPYSATSGAAVQFTTLIPTADVPAWDALFGGLVLPTSLLAPPVEVHEWGTFTSVQSPDGEDMEGLHHEEEPLPSFVHGRGGMCWGVAKCMEIVPVGVTQKMETPVIYFHGTPKDTAGDAVATVRVDFPKGIISQWFPEATAWEPALGSLNGAETLGGGAMTWTVTFNPEGFAPPVVSESDIWAPSRRVPAATPLRGPNGEDEHFIFYRGIGRFSLPVRTVSVPGDVDEVQVWNDHGADIIPAAFLVRVEEGGAGIVPLGEIAAGGQVTRPDQVPLTDMERFIADARGHLTAALTESGLTLDEPVAMVDTWAVSYFHTPGLRVLYVLPRAWPDELLPLTLSFEPTRVVRTLVGRIEVTTHDELDEVEGAFLAAIAAGVNSWETLGMKEVLALGRYAEAKMRALRERTDDAEVITYLDEVIRQLEQQPEDQKALRFRFAVVLVRPDEARQHAQPEHAEHDEHRDRRVDVDGQLPADVTAFVELVPRLDEHLRGDVEEHVNDGLLEVG